MSLHHHQLMHATSEKLNDQPTRTLGYVTMLFVIAFCFSTSLGCRAITPAATPPPPFHNGMDAPVRFPAPPNAQSTFQTPATLTHPFTAQRIALLDLVDHTQLPVILENSGPVLVDFYADWCQPCQEQGQVLQQLSRQSIGDAKIVKVNVDRHAELVKMFKVEGLPTLVLFKDGQAVSRKTGFASAAELTQLLKK